ncbi:MAG: large subunit ribosomal protein L21 [Candidatus Endobugula sp.]|jgi:large subunit ribosomal protein L21
MYAVIKSGGKQHRVTEGETLKLEKIEAATGETIQFDEVLLVTDGDNITIGTPIVKGAAVTAEILSHGRGDKIRIIKFRRRKHSMTRQGHRQWFTEVKITAIIASGAKKVLVEKVLVEKVLVEKVPVKKVAAKKADAAPADGDDLSKLTGVGPVLVKKLVEAGVTRFAQIAAWSVEDIALIDEKLNLKGRVERDDWIAQAKELTK